MWRSSKRAVVGCIRLIMRCGRDNLEADDAEDMSEYDVHDIPGSTFYGERFIVVTCFWNGILSAIDISRGIIKAFTVQCPPVHIQPQIFPMALQQRQDEFPHRPDAPGTKRRSPPEVVSKMVQALEEMNEVKSLSTVEKMRTCHRRDFESSFPLANEEK